MKRRAPWRSARSCWSRTSLRFSAIFLAPSLTAIVLRAPAWIVIPLGTLCSIGMSMSLLIDTQVYQLYRFHINAGVMNLLFGGAARETFVFPADVCAGGDDRRRAARHPGARCILLVALRAGSSWQACDAARRRPGTAGRAGRLSCLHIWASAVAYEPVLEQTEVLPLRYAASANRMLRKLGIEVSSQPVPGADPGRSKSALAYPLHPMQCRRPAGPPNIIVILIDSWRFDALDERVTPNIHAFAQRSVAVHESLQRRQCYAHRRVLIVLFHPRHLLAPGPRRKREPVFIEQLLKQGMACMRFVARRCIALSSTAPCSPASPAYACAPTARDRPIGTAT